MNLPRCEQCEELQSRLEAALQERDEALLALARAREELNRQKLAGQWAQEEAIPAYPLEAGAAWPVPLRYRLVDSVNTWVKARVPYLQGLRHGWKRRHHDE
jgi:hypothetical protein